MGERAQHHPPNPCHCGHAARATALLATLQQCAHTLATLAAQHGDVRHPLPSRGMPEAHITRPRL